VVERREAVATPLISGDEKDVPGVGAHLAKWLVIFSASFFSSP
jgi:hypothetical protein